MRSSRAAVLPLFAILVPVFLGLAALVVDVSIAASQAERERRDAVQIALSMLETFYDQSPQKNAEQRLLSVNQRGSQLMNSLGYDGSLLMHRAPQEPSPSSGVIHFQPGRFFVERVTPAECASIVGATCGSPRPSDGRVSPCGDRDTPCFLRNTTATAPISAFRLIGEIRRERPSIFGRIFGVSLFPRTIVDVTVTSTPRRILFLVDISRSVTRETFVEQSWVEQFQQSSDPSAPQGSEYAFEPRVFCPAPPQPATLSSISCPSVGDLSESDDDANWWYLQYFRRTRSNLCPVSDADSRQHFLDDYSEVIPFSTYGNQPDQNWLQLDAHVNPGTCTTQPLGKYCVEQPNGQPRRFFVHSICDRPGGRCANSPSCRGPEPLNTIYGAVARAATLLFNRQVAGDRIGFIFFDQRTEWTRFVPLTANFEYVRDVVTSPERRRLLRLFPGRDAYTDLRLAIQEAFGEYSRLRLANPSNLARDSIILITDGLTNCTECLAANQLHLALADGAVGFWEKGFITEADRRYVDSLNASNLSVPKSDLYAAINACMGRAFGCVDSFHHYRSSMAQVLQTVRQQSVAQAGVSINVLAVGGAIGPHRRVIRHNNRCLTDDELRLEQAQGRLLEERPVRGGTRRESTCPPSSNPDDDVANDCLEGYADPSPSFPFFQPLSDLYDIARATQGVFHAMIPQMAAHCGESPNLCRGNPQDGLCCGQHGDIQTTDVFCRTPQQQVDEFIDKVFLGEAPFMTVDAN